MIKRRPIVGYDPLKLWILPNSPLCWEHYEAVVLHVVVFLIMCWCPPSHCNLSWPQEMKSVTWSQVDTYPYNGRSKLTRHLGLSTIWPSAALKISSYACAILYILHGPKVSLPFRQIARLGFTQMKSPALGRNPFDGAIGGTFTLASVVTGLILTEDSGFSSVRCEENMVLCVEYRCCMHVKEPFLYG